MVLGCGIFNQGMVGKVKRVRTRSAGHAGARRQGKEGVVTSTPKEVIVGSPKRQNDIIPATAIQRGIAGLNGHQHVIARAPIDQFSIRAHDERIIPAVTVNRLDPGDIIPKTLQQRHPGAAP